MITMIIGMAIVTAVPRFLPAFVVDKWEFPDWVDRWLQAIPYAALGALIFPGILTVIPDQPWIGWTVLLVGSLLAFFKLNVIVVVGLSIVTVYVLTLL
ncbi:branched-chain amino acid transporter [Pontibacillus halophilus JSM 076056 = DSM 19796]|uniref:Branched-chain amino acid transporter n=1 Tax=Pontibacillus halophilus JSM 076056 = DSM 19796 TaxID=1385510 RepID=A0A0A5GMW9_9BACI|nr:AzlD domain-containing protein [Pontibacillus halophilus]KGX92563.1 branched-chain amino acid transporter [Pontibacillus halophilus JSM 076056 = DSM 19796]